MYRLTYGCLSACSAVSRLSGLNCNSACSRSEASGGTSISSSSRGFRALKSTNHHQSLITTYTHADSYTCSTCMAPVLFASDCHLVLLSGKAKVQYLLQRFLHETDSRSEARNNVGSGSWLAWDNVTAVHYAATHCPRERTIGPVVCS